MKFLVFPKHAITQYMYCAFHFQCKHTLRILHIDKNIFLGDDLDTALQELFPLNSTSVLEVVNAAQTNISESSVEWVDCALAVVQV